MRLLLLPVCLAIVLAPAALCQTTTPPATHAQSPQLSPKAAYDSAMHPLEITRQSFSNWSDTEIAALKVTVARAADECKTRKPETFQGSPLIDLARLCALGQIWSATIDSAKLYIDQSHAPDPLLSQAYNLLVDAQLHARDRPGALASTQAMLSTVPYDALAAVTTNEAINYMQFLDTPDALAIANTRQPLLLKNLQAFSAPSSATPATPAVAPQADSQTIHDLYADGIVLPILQQFSKVPAETITATLATLDAALPATLPADESIPIATTRRRYALLGQPLAPIQALESLSLPKVIPEIPANHAITSLLLFPDWCAQCLRMSSKFPESVFTVRGHEAYLYGLLFETVPPNKPTTDRPNPPAPFTPADAANLISGTPTLLVKPDLADKFTAADFPFLIIADSFGMIRVVQPVDEDSILPGNTIDSAISAVGAQWPLPLHAPAKAVSLPGRKFTQPSKPLTP